MRLHSIRTRLMVWTGLLITLILSAGSVAIYHTIRSSLYEEVDEALSASLILQALELEIVGHEVVHDWLSDLEADPRRSAEDYTQVWDVRTGLTKRSPALNGGDLPRISGVLNDPHYSSFILPNGRRARAAGMLVYPASDESGGDALVPTQYPHVMVTARETALMDAALHRLFWSLVVGLLTSVCVSAIAISCIIRNSLRPIQVLEDEILKVDVDNPREVLSIPADLPLELVGLGHEYGQLLDRISRVRLRERDFASNASHELRTPLAAVSAILEQALAHPREVADYQVRLREALQVTIGMHGLVGRLMWLARLQNRVEPVVSIDVDLHAMIELRCSIAEESAQERGITLQQQFDLPCPMIRGDENLLSILLSNLLSNAVAHGDTESSVLVQTQSCAEGACLRISNPAHGLQSVNLSRLTEPFYSMDAVRTAEGNHFGIGLALVQEIVATLDWKLRLSVTDDSLFVVEVIFPKN